MTDLINEFKIIDEEILNWNKKDNNKLKKIYTGLENIKRKVIRIQLSFVDDELFNSEKHTMSLRQVDNLMKAINISESFLHIVHEQQNRKNMRHLSIITTIGLPLSIITGFFGMNFKFMGIDPGGNGILRWKNAELILVTIIIFTICLVRILFYSNII